MSQLVPERPRSMFEHPIITKDRQRLTSDTLVMQESESGDNLLRLIVSHEEIFICRTSLTITLCHHVKGTVQRNPTGAENGIIQKVVR